MFELLELLKVCITLPLSSPPPPLTHLITVLLFYTKGKYTTLMDMKSRQNDEMVVLQGEKVSLARALVELKMQHSALMETSERDKFDLTSSVLALKNELFELDNTNIVAKVELAGALDKLEKLQALFEKEKNENLGARCVCVCVYLYVRAHR